jgi:Domain of unknown function (DUF4383)
MTTDRTPAQLYALLFGAVLLVVGIVGFAADSSFGSGSDVDGSNLIAFEVNGWHNLVHLASGAVGLLLARTVSGARAFALGFGAIYLVVTLWGFIDGNAVLWLVPVNTPDNFLHLALGTLGIAAGLAPDSREVRARAVTA